MEDDFLRTNRSTVTRFLITRARLSAQSVSIRPPCFAGDANHAKSRRSCKRFLIKFLQMLRRRIGHLSQAPVYCLYPATKSIAPVVINPKKTMKIPPPAPTAMKNVNRLAPAPGMNASAPNTMSCLPISFCLRRLSSIGERVFFFLGASSGSDAEDQIGSGDGFGFAGLAATKACFCTGWFTGSAERSDRRCGTQSGCAGGLAKVAEDMPGNSPNGIHSVPPSTHAKSLALISPDATDSRTCSTE